MRPAFKAATAVALAAIVGSAFGQTYSFSQVAPGTAVTADVPLILSDDDGQSPYTCVIQPAEVGGVLTVFEAMPDDEIPQALVETFMPPDGGGVVIGFAEPSASTEGDQSDRALAIPLPFFQPAQMRVLYVLLDIPCIFLYFPSPIDYLEPLIRLRYQLYLEGVAIASAELDFDLPADSMVRASGIELGDAERVEIGADGGLFDTAVLDVAYVDNATGDQVAAGIALWAINPQIVDMCPADLSPPYGVLNFADVQAFLAAFGSGAPAADLALPHGVLNFADAQAFLTSFGAGCDGGI